MWDNTEMIRNLANALYTLCALMMLYGSIHYVAYQPTLFPLRYVELADTPQRVSTSNIMQVAREEVRGNLLTVDIQHVRESLEKLPWVRTVSIRREFPGSLVVKLEEQQVLARWNSNMLVNRFGEVFVADTNQQLPEFNGPEGSAAEVTNNYAQFSQQLERVDLNMARIDLSARHAWKLSLDNGVVLELGRENMQQRLERFIEVYPYSLAAQVNKLKYVDLRYRNGFAVSGQVRQG